MTSDTSTRRIPRLGTFLGQEHGQAIAEFAVVLPLLMLIIVGILTFGRYMNYSSQETQMAAEAARWAAVNVNPSSSQSLQSYVQSQATGELLNGSSDVTSPVQVYLYYPTGSSNTAGSSVRACVTATVRLLPMLGAGPTDQIVETATMRIEQAATNWSTSNNPAAVPSQCPTS
jgi:Flp pilus assembly protein TadG